MDKSTKLNIAGLSFYGISLLLVSTLAIEYIMFFVSITTAIIMPMCFIALWHPIFIQVKHNNKLKEALRANPPY